MLVSEAASAFDVQLAGLELLQASALKSAAEAGIEGKAALATLTTYFDSRAARYILKGDIAITIDPLPMALGVLPLIPLALHLWFRSPCPTQAALTPPILLAAQASTWSVRAPPPTFTVSTPSSWPTYALRAPGNPTIGVPSTGPSSGLSPSLSTSTTPCPRVAPSHPCSGTSLPQTSRSPGVGACMLGPKGSRSPPWNSIPLSGSSTTSWSPRTPSTRPFVTPPRLPPLVTPLRPLPPIHPPQSLLHPRGVWPPLLPAPCSPHPSLRASLQSRPRTSVVHLTGNTKSLLPLAPTWWIALTSSAPKISWPTLPPTRPYGSTPTLVSHGAPKTVLPCAIASSFI